MSKAIHFLSVYVFENVINLCLEIYELDAAKISAPSMGSSYEKTL